VSYSACVPIQNPHDTIVGCDAKSAMMATDSHGPESSPIFLKVKRRVPWIALKALVGLIGRSANAPRQRSIARPKVGGRVVLQRRVVLRPA